MKQTPETILEWIPETLSSMPPSVFAVVAIAVCYLLGSIPFGLLVGLANGVDVRKQGSGNIGATNTGRVLGRRFGFLVFALDFFKGAGPLTIVKVYCFKASDVFTHYDLPVYCAAAAVIGHVFPIWLGFRGGKAGATGLGVGAVLSPWAMLVSALVFLIVVFATRYVSLGTILAAISYAGMCLGRAAMDDGPWQRETRALTVFVLLISLLLIIRHSSNIKRLIAGTESKIGSSGG